MALPIHPLLYVSERDIDLLLMEELTVSPQFAVWLACRSGLDLSASAELAGAWHSVMHPMLGESDLIAVWSEPDGHRIALLIEDKIDACAQPTQGQRYWQRGEAGIDSGDWDLFDTCMIAPARYLDSSTDAKEYGTTISYESIREFLLHDSRDNARSRYRASVLLSAIGRHRRGYSPVIDNDVTKFWLDFWRMSLELCPRLGMTQPASKPAGAGWIWVRPPELGGNHWIGFKLLLGIVDLQIDGAVDQIDRIDALCLDHLDGEVRAVSTGRSASLRVEVEPVDVTGDFQTQRQAVATAFEGAARLLDAWKRIGGEIDDE